MRQAKLLKSVGIVSTVAAMLFAPARADEAVVVIAHAPLRGINAEQIKRIYMGRVIELDGQVLHPVQLTRGQPLRLRFHARVLQQSEDDYFAYWTVRRYIGKGTPPQELPSAADVLAYVQRTPGAIGYLDASEIKAGTVVVYRH